MESPVKLGHETIDRVCQDPAKSDGREPFDMGPRPMTGFFALLTPEQQAAALHYCGPDDLGELNAAFLDAK